MPDLPTRGLVRGARLARSLPAAFVGRRAVGLGRASVAGRRRLIAAEVQARTAEQLFAVLGELKGGAMKVGQWMSAMEAALPEQLAGPYGEALDAAAGSRPGDADAHGRPGAHRGVRAGLARPVHGLRRDTGGRGEHRPGAPRDLAATAGRSR